jgi:hypothetical protein
VACQVDALHSAVDTECTPYGRKVVRRQGNVIAVHVYNV